MATEGSKQHSSPMWCFDGGGGAVLRVCPAGVVVATRETVVGGSSAGAGASCPMGCVCSTAEVSCRNLDLEDAPVAELRAASAAGRDWSGITKL